MNKRDEALAKLYGITKDERDTMLRKQKGLCLACKEKCKWYEGLSIDYDPEKETVRGLVCHDCKLLIQRVNGCSRGFIKYLKRRF